MAHAEAPPLPGANWWVVHTASLEKALSIAHGLSPQDAMLFLLATCDDDGTGIRKQGESDGTH